MFEMEAITIIILAIVIGLFLGRVTKTWRKNRSEKNRMKALERKFGCKIGDQVKMTKESAELWNDFLERDFGISSDSVFTVEDFRGDDVEISTGGLNIGCLSGACYEKIEDARREPSPRKSSNGLGLVITIVGICIVSIVVLAWLLANGCSKHHSAKPAIKPTTVIANPNSTPLSAKSDSAKAVATDPVKHDTLQVDSVWKEVRGHSQYFFRFDFDQSNVLQVRLSDGRIFERTNDLWFFHGDIVSVLPLDLNPPILYLKSKTDKSFEVIFSTWSK